ncbi:global repressor Tup1p [Mycena galericulata]|nr:global repressor Tup1p [Mycena galericulata]
MKPGYDMYIRSVRFSPDGKYLAIGAEDERIRIWDIEKRTVKILEGHHKGDIYSLDFSLDGRRLVSGGDASVCIWDTKDYSPVRMLNAQPESEDDAAAMSVAISPDGAFIAAGCVDALVRVWNIDTGELIDVLRGHQNSVHSVVFTRDGGGVMSGALDNTVRIWDLRGKTKEGIPCKVLAGHQDYVLSVDISRNGQWIVSGSRDRCVHFCDSAGVVQCWLQGHKESVLSTSLHSTDNLLATGSRDNLARIWRYKTV